MAAASGVVSGYVIEARRPGTSYFFPVALAPAEATSFFIAQYGADTVRVRAWNVAGLSEPSAEIGHDVAAAWACDSPLTRMPGRPVPGAIDFRGMRSGEGQPRTQARLSETHGAPASFRRPGRRLPAQWPELKDWIATEALKNRRRRGHRG